MHLLYLVNVTTETLCFTLNGSHFEDAAMIFKGL